MGSVSDLVSQMPRWHAKWNAAVPAAILDVTVFATDAFWSDCRQHDVAAPDDGLLVGCMLDGTMFPHACAQALTGAAPTVIGGSAITPSGTADDAYTGDTLAYSWAPTSPAATATDQMSATASFTAPGISADTAFTFTLTANDWTVDAADTMGDDRTRAAGGQGGDNNRRVQGGAGVGAGERVSVPGGVRRVRDNLAGACHAAPFQEPLDEWSAMATAGMIP